VPRARTGALDVNGQRLSVSQEPAPCRFELSASGQRVPPAGATGSVNVSSAEGCAWTAASPVPWLTIVAGGSGSGSGTVRYAVAANNGPERSAVLTVAGQQHTVDQDPAPLPPSPAPPPPTPPPPGPTPPPPTCDASVSPSSLSFAAAGGEAAVRVSVDGGCAWQAASPADWLSVSPTRGSGPSNVTVTARANTTTEGRTSAVSIAGQTVGVTQSGSAPAVVQLSGEIRNPDGDCPNRRFTVNGTRVAASASTEYVDSACSDLRNRRAVFVQGLQRADGTVAATRIRVIRDDDD
jgi:hypothetical protein